MKRNILKRTLLAAAIGAISAGVAGGALAQDAEDDTELNGDAAVSEEQPNHGTDTPQNASDDDHDDEDDLDADGDDVEDYEDIDADDMDTDDEGSTEANLDESLGAMQVSELEGMTVINMEDEAIGDVQEVVKHNDTGDLHTVITVGGFWGMGGSDISLPLAEMRLEDDQLVFQQTYGEDELESGNEYDEDRYSEVDDDMTLSEAWGR
ncbi:PRC-barrel domain-containing protein [Halomonas sp. ML-15]|uniref:PRC-barrel domain-containing protein n=1 Tax=Halomonas sp. ML-15 TaxID=2773305 RepID=UPI001747326D|nr:PRC-barrel domain-containing protein [Halomonas sp. ML-15]MBD3895594.1 PRC-barrel domain-containing protein [Halomonas sp. ML-15]